MTKTTSFTISGPRSGGSTDMDGDSINGEQDDLVSQVLSRQPELFSRYSRVQIYRMVERGEIDGPDPTNETVVRKKIERRPLPVAPTTA